jgi:hypothetical protein
MQAVCTHRFIASGHGYEILLVVLVTDTSIVRAVNASDTSQAPRLAIPNEVLVIQARATHIAANFHRVAEA